MCLQCTVKSVTVKKDFLPGYELQRATNDAAPLAWPKDALGLVQENDPYLVFTTPVIAKPPKNADNPTTLAYITTIWDLLDEINLHPIETAAFLKLCRKEGFRGREDWRSGFDAKAHFAFNAEKFKVEHIKEVMAQYEALGWRCELEKVDRGEFPTHDYQYYLTMY